MVSLVDNPGVSQSESVVVVDQHSNKLQKGNPICYRLPDFVKAVFLRELLKMTINNNWNTVSVHDLDNYPG